MKPQSVVGIIGFNSAEYLFTLQGSWLSGCVPAGIYTTNSPDACQYVLEHSEAEVCVCQGGKNAVKIASIRENLPHLKAIVVYWPEEGMPDVENKEGLAKVMNWEDFLKTGDHLPDSQVEKRAEEVKPGNCATLIYTSGTTGNPKAVMCSHDNCFFNSYNTPWYINMSDTENRLVSYLPMNHIAAQFVDSMLPVIKPTTIYLARPDALRGTLVATLRKARPTFFVGVPRVWEKFAESLRASFAGYSTLKGMLVSWFRSIGTTHSYYRQYGLTPYTPWFYSLAKARLFDPVKEKLGLDQCTCYAVSAAPITEGTLNFFASLDMPILDVLGQSEVTAPVCFNTHNNQEWRMYTAGRPMRGVQARVDPDTNEVQFKGRLIMMGYMKMPAETAATIDEDGWMHTGDQAIIDADGFVKITGRLKELIVTAGGENVSPVPIENKILELCPLIANCVVVGDKRKFLSCLMSLKTEVDPITGEPTNKLLPSVIDALKAKGSTATTLAEAREDPVVKKIIDEAVEGYNKVAISRAQEVRKWYMMERDLSIGHGELTATMKLKRNVVHEHYVKEIDSLYV